MNVFHAHLDVCERCRTQPLDLCRLGAQALRAAVNMEGLDLVDPDDLKTIVVREPESGESFSVELDIETRINVAAFCEVSGLTVREVFERALEEYLDSKHPPGYGPGV